ncbi:MAG TPA: sulfatase/phosphatase domain-containing protein, partial [Planctomycetota bacterium]|nr:sulfatase/phosphatase domain-containing protein [Planctomycetota bacterium]
SGPVSIMDVGPTLCELAAAEPPPGSDGTSLATVLSGEPVEPTRHVLSEYVDRGTRDEATPGRMVRRGKWKFITYAGYEQDDLLFDLETDPHEMSNLAKTEPAVAEALRSIALAGWDTEAIVRRFRENAAHARVLSRWGAAVDVDEPERWPVPDRFRTEPPPVTED